MRNAILFALIAMSIPAAATDEGAESITYDVVRVEGKLYLEAEPEEQRLSVGDQAVSGDRLRTGSSSSATIGVPSHTTVFRLQAKTSCTLAHDRPGVLLHLEKGRLRALFGAFTGTDPRLVTTPSAVLAVRGTEYGLQSQEERRHRDRGFRRRGRGHRSCRGEPADPGGGRAAIAHQDRPAGRGAHSSSPHARRLGPGPIIVVSGDGRRWTLFRLAERGPRSPWRRRRGQPEVGPKNTEGESERPTVAVNSTPTSALTFWHGPCPLTVRRRGITRTPGRTQGGPFHETLNHPHRFSGAGSRRIRRDGGRRFRSRRRSISGIRGHRHRRRLHRRLRFGSAHAHGR